MVKEHSKNDSIRTKSKLESNSNSKIVYRPVLENPLNLNWPSFSSSIRNSILEALITFLTQTDSIINSEGNKKEESISISDWRLQEHAKKRGRIHGAGKDKSKGKGKEVNEVGENGKRIRSNDNSKESKSKKSKLSNDMMDTTTDSNVTSTTESSTSIPITLDETTSHTLDLRSQKTYIIPTLIPKPLPVPSTSKVIKLSTPTPRPSLLNHFCVGINEVTKLLETRIRYGRSELGDENALPISNLIPTQASESTNISTSEKESKGSDKKKIRVRHHKLSKEKEKLKEAERKPDEVVLPIAPKSKLKPLNLLHPTSSTTLQRPSFDFLSQATPKLHRNLPPYLLAPEDPNPFFAPPVRNYTIPIDHLEISRAELRRTFLEDVIRDDDPVGDRLERKRKEKDSKIVERSMNRPSGVQLPLKKLSEFHQKLADTTVITKTTEEILEAKAEAERIRISNSKKFNLIFVCRPDINPPSLVAHLPSMVAAANGVSEALNDLEEKSAAGKEKNDEEMEVDKDEDFTRLDNVFLIALDVGAEKKLATALALRRVTTIAVSSTAPNITPLLNLIQQHVTPLQAQWLKPHLIQRSTTIATTSIPIPQVLIPTHIKHLKSTAPIDMKAALAAKKEEKRIRKEGKKKKEVYIAVD